MPPTNRGVLLRVSSSRALAAACAAHWPALIFLRCGQKAVEMMGAARALFRRGLGGDQRKVGVNLPGIGVDHLPVQSFG